MLWCTIGWRPYFDLPNRTASYFDSVSRPVLPLNTLLRRASSHDGIGEGDSLQVRDAVLVSLNF